MYRKVMNQWHDVYKAMEGMPEADAIDDAYNAIRQSLERNEVACANDDRAEMLVAAITAYMVQSDQEIRAIARKTTAADKVQALIGDA